MDEVPFSKLFQGHNVSKGEAVSVLERVQANFPPIPGIGRIPNQVLFVRGCEELELRYKIIIN